MRRVLCVLLHWQRTRDFRRDCCYCPRCGQMFR